MAVVFTWVFNHTRASIFIAILLHASVDSMLRGRYMALHYKLQLVSVADHDEQVSVDELLAA
jgi:hypothetical protein